MQFYDLSFFQFQKLIFFDNISCKRGKCNIFPGKAAENPIPKRRGFLYKLFRCCHAAQYRTSAVIARLRSSHGNPYSVLLLSLRGHEVTVAIRGWRIQTTSRTHWGRALPARNEFCPKNPTAGRHFWAKGGFFPETQVFS